jgi:hypothetical protein
MALADDVEEEYKRRFRALATDDLDGHYRLAQWCKEQEAYRLLSRQCNHILKKNKDHEPARLLLELARRKLAASPQDEAGNAGTRKPLRGDLGRILNSDDIQVLRRSELFLDRPERVAVKFHNRVLERFFAELEGAPGFDFTRRRFFKLPPAEKAQLILRFAPEAYGKDVEITRDPLRFVTFERKVLPIALDNCATAACHGTNGRAKWRLYSDKVLSKNLVYTNYLIMHELSRGDERLIDRDFPERSLLLSYGLPDVAPGPDHPTNHPVAIDPPFSDRNDRNGRKYRQILDWLESLSVPAPDYGISLELPKTPE